MKTLIKNSNNSSTPASKERMKDEIVIRTKLLCVSCDEKTREQKGNDVYNLFYSFTSDEVIDDIPCVYLLLMNNIIKAECRNVS